MAYLLWILSLCVFGFVIGVLIRPPFGLLIAAVTGWVIGEPLLNFFLSVV